MLPSIFLTVLAGGVATAMPGMLPRSDYGAYESNKWIAPGPDDSRSPCPGLNTLANHGFLYVFLSPLPPQPPGANRVAGVV
jgi:hypothetical protein